VSVRLSDITQYTVSHYTVQSVSYYTVQCVSLHSTVCIILHSTVCVSLHSTVCIILHSTLCLITKLNNFILCWDILVLCCNICMKLINTLCGKNAEFLMLILRRFWDLNSKFFAERVGSKFVSIQNSYSEQRLVLRG
jgi:hypothetical protein